MIEQLIEKMILEGKIKREDLDEMIAKQALLAPYHTLSKENDVLRLQVDATNSYMDFLEEVIVEMAMMTYE